MIGLLLGDTVVSCHIGYIIALNFMSYKPNIGLWTRRCMTVSCPLCLYDYSCVYYVA